MSGTSRSGRRPKPSSIRKLEGSRTRPHHYNEPKFASCIPEMPEFIQADALAAERWRVMAARLSAAGVLKEAHGEILSLLCSAWADLVRAREQFAQMGYQQLTVDERILPSGERIRKVKTNPLILRIEKQAYQVARFLGEFGLTPMTSAKVSAEQAVTGSDDPFAKFLEGNPYSN